MYFYIKDAKKMGNGEVERTLAQPKRAQPKRVAALKPIGVGSDRFLPLLRENDKARVEHKAHALQSSVPD